MTQAQKPKATMHDMPSSGGERLEHPAFGNISVSRYQGGDVSLNGSDFKHNQYNALRIEHETVDRHLGREWHHATGKIIEILMSESQWSRFVSSIGLGAGTPVTIDWTKESGRLPRIDYTTPVEHLKIDAIRRLKELAEPIESLRDEIEKTPMSGKSRRLLTETVDALIAQMTSALPFYIKSVEEQLEKSTEAAREEVHAYVNNTLMSLGLDAAQADILKLGSLDD